MRLVSLLKFFVAAISLALLYMLVTQELPFGSRHGGAGAELITLREDPLRFILLFIFLGVFDLYLLKTLRRLSRDN